MKYQFKSEINQTYESKIQKLAPFIFFSTLDSLK